MGQPFEREPQAMGTINLFVYNPVTGTRIKCGYFRDQRNLKSAGIYLLGPRLANSPVRSIVQCLARKMDTDKFYTLKILTLQNLDEETQDDRQGKMLLHTEHALLSLLHDQEGVIHHHGIFKDECWEEKEEGDDYVLTGYRKERVILVLDCLSPHDYSSENAAMINLQHHVIREKKLHEKDAILIFYEIVNVVSSLHRKNIVHRDLKLGNIMLNRLTRKIIITNFCLGKHLLNENDLLRDQRGSPAYISPDVLFGKPYLGKPSDMWALGVVLFTMLYGQFPFYDHQPQELFRKIKTADYTIPSSEDHKVSESSNMIIKKLLVLNANVRMTADQVLEVLNCILHTVLYKVPFEHEFQVVPEIDEPTPKKKKDDDWDRVVPSLKNAHGIDETSVFPLQCKPSTSSTIPKVFDSDHAFKKYGVFPVSHVNEDEQPLTTSDILKFHHFLPRPSNE